MISNNVYRHINYVLFLFILLIIPDISRSDKIPDQVILRLEGSDTIGFELMPELAKAYLMKKGGSSVHIVIAESGDSDKLAAKRYVRGFVNGKYEIIEIVANGSDNAFKCIASETCSIGMSSRPFSKEKDGEGFSYSLRDPSKNLEFQIGWDAVAIIVNKFNEIDEISIEDLSDIFSGKTQEWKNPPISGDPSIVVLKRPSTSGTNEFIKIKILSGKPFSKKAISYDSHRELSSKLDMTANAIGYVSLTQIPPNKALRIKYDRNKTPVYPSYKNVSSNRYPLARKMFLYTLKNSNKYEEKKFINFVLSDDGKNIIKENGFIPTIQDITSSIPETDIITGVPTKGRNRLDLSIQFTINDDNIDKQSRDYLEKAVKYIIKHNKNNKVIIIGHTDSSGSDASNIALSKRRARKVEEFLLSRNIQPIKVLGVGEADPIDSNKTSNGRARNRRVEIWVEN